MSTPRQPPDSVRTPPGPWWLFTTKAHCPVSATPPERLAITAARRVGNACASPASLGGSVPAVERATMDSHTASHATVAGAFVRRRRGSASALHARSGPSVKCVTHIPSASTPWLAAKAATAPGVALLLGLPPQNATGTMGSADANPESQGGGVTYVLPGFTTSLSAFPAAATEMGLSQGSVTLRLGLASARRMWKVQNALCVGKAHSTWTQQIPRVVPAAFVLE